MLAADHVFEDGKQFARLCAQAARRRTAGEIVTFGITPDHPGDRLRLHSPGRAAGDRSRSCGGSNDSWRNRTKNARARSSRTAICGTRAISSSAPTSCSRSSPRFEPEIAAAAVSGGRRANKDLGFVVLDHDSFARAPKTSIDYAVMERTDKAAVLTADVGWSDVGEWSAVWRLSPRDANGNSFRGRAVAIDSANVLVRSEEQLAAVIGLKDVIVVATRDAVLVADRSQSDKVKARRAAEGGGPARSNPASAQLSAVGLLSEHRPGLALSGQAHRCSPRRPPVPAETPPPRRALGGRARRRRGDAQRQGRARA